jgi:hypothetical protein
MHLSYVLLIMRGYIVFQQAAQPLPTPHHFSFSTDCLSRQREQQYIVFALVISFLMIRSGAARAAMNLHPTRSASPGIPP